MTEALRRRREREIAPFTVMSCDNLQGNGTPRPRRVHRRSRGCATRSSATGSSARCASRTRWSTASRRRRRDEDIEEVDERFGVEDRWPVVCEPFIQWVLEDSFSAGRPPYEDVGVQVVDDVEPYELMKLRLLNASHQALAYFGYLCGYRLVHDAAQDPLFQRFLLARYMDEEATPTLAPVPGVDLDDYKRTLIERFSNPERPRHDRRGCARRARTASRSGCCRSSAQQLAVGGRDQALGSDRRELGALRRGRRRAGRADRGRRPAARES